jgi:hypothetical protein
VTIACHDTVFIIVRVVLSSDCVIFSSYGALFRLCDFTLTI